jgi:hypothetical protein
LAARVRVAIYCRYTNASFQEGGGVTSTAESGIENAVFAFEESEDFLE